MSVIEKNYQLEAYFHDAGKPREQWRVGTEYEKVGIDRHTGKAIPYYGPRGVARILRELIDRYGWEPEEQDGNIILVETYVGLGHRKSFLSFSSITAGSVLVAV